MEDVDQIKEILNGYLSASDVGDAWADSIEFGVSAGYLTQEDAKRITVMAAGLTMQKAQGNPKVARLLSQEMASVEIHDPERWQNAVDSCLEAIEDTFERMAAMKDGKAHKDIN